MPAQTTFLGHCVEATASLITPSIEEGVGSLCLGGGVVVLVVTLSGLIGGSIGVITGIALLILSMALLWHADKRSLSQKKPPLETECLLKAPLLQEERVDGTKETPSRKIDYVAWFDSRPQPHVEPSDQDNDLETPLIERGYPGDPILKNRAPSGRHGSSAPPPISQPT